jgi:uncharacterized protein with von Willebrand factor type A (vWA) domain
VWPSDRRPWDWPAEWQRHSAALRELVADEEGQAEVLPGFTVHGMDIRKWLARQCKSEAWQALHDGQRERLERLGTRRSTRSRRSPRSRPRRP